MSSGHVLDHPQSGVLGKESHVFGSAHLRKEANFDGAASTSVSEDQPDAPF